MKKVATKQIILHKRTSSKPSDVHANSYPHRDAREVYGPPPPSRVFDMFQYSKRLYLQWKAFDLLRYVLWVVVPLEACDSTTMVSILAAILG